MRRTEVTGVTRCPTTGPRPLVVRALLAALVTSGLMLGLARHVTSAFAQPPSPVLAMPQSVGLAATVRVTVIPGLMVGDVSLDGQTTLFDSMFVMQYRAGIRSLDNDQLFCADTNADGSVSMVDAMHIMQFRADPDGSSGILYKPLYDPVFHAGMIDPMATP